jgi:hypothetical protein
VDAINSLVSGTQRAQATFDAAAVKLAGDGLPTTAAQAPIATAAAAVAATSVDPAEQLTTMMVAADVHHATTAALRAALALYSTSVDMLAPGIDPSDG